MIQQFKGFVGKVYHVPSVQIEVIGGSSKDHICYYLLGQAQIYGSPEAAFRSFIIPYVDEVSEPPLEHLRTGLLWVGSGSTRNLGSLPAHSLDTCSTPWYNALLWSLSAR
jgi:hypothetical protein